MSEDTLNQSDATEEVSSEPQETSSAQPSETENSVESSSDQPKEVPFHEHPRWKEVMEERKQLSERNQAYEKQLAEMQDAIRNQQRQVQSLTPKQKQEEDVLVARLKGIDPEFAERMETLSKSQQELQELRQWKEQYTQQQQRTEAEKIVDGLHEQNNVPKELRKSYRAQLLALAQENPNLTIQDIPKAYKMIHDEMSGFLESMKRDVTKGYVAEKSKDAKAPVTQPKGKPAPVGQKPQFSKDPDVARQEMIKRVLSQAKSENEI